MDSTADTIYFGDASLSLLIIMNSLFRELAGCIWGNRNHFSRSVVIIRLINQMSKMSQPRARERPEERSASKNFKSCKCRFRDGRLYMTGLLKTLVQLCNVSLLSVTTTICDVTPRLTAMPAEDLTETLYLLKQMLSVLGSDARGRDWKCGYAQKFSVRNRIVNS